MDIKSNQTIGLTCKLRYIDRQIDAAATLVHAFVTSRLDHCCSVLVGLPLTMTAHLDRVLRFAARLIGGVPKYASISSYMRDTLHWLPIRQHFFYRVAVLVWHCLIGFAPVYLMVAQTICEELTWCRGVCLNPCHRSSPLMLRDQKL